MHVMYVHICYEILGNLVDHQTINHATTQYNLAHTGGLGYLKTGI